MINKIGIQNFRVFKDLQEFELKPFTILTGTNNSGKSTLQKVLFLLNKSITTRNGIPSFDELIFDSEMIGRIDSYTKNINYKSDNNCLLLSFDVLGSFYKYLHIKLKYEPSVNNKIHLKAIEIFQDTVRIMFFDKIPFNQYIEECNFLDKKMQSESFEGKYVWRLNPDIDTKQFAKVIYNALAYEKIDFLKQHWAVKIDAKLKTTGELNDEEEGYKKALENDGLLFNDQRAIDIANKYASKYSDVSPIEFMHVWDSKNNSWWKIDIKLKRSCEMYYDLDDKILIPTKLSQIVIEEKTFFESTLDNDGLRRIREKLVENEIFNKEQFILAYKQFEVLLIFFNSYERVPEFRYTDFATDKDGYMLFQVALEFSNFFMVENTGSQTISRFLRLILDRKNVIAEILLSKEYKKLFKQDHEVKGLTGLEKIMHSQSGTCLKPNTYQDEMNHLGSMCDKIQSAVLEPVRLLGESLSNDTKNIRFGFQDTVIKRHLFYADTNKQNLIYYDFANELLQKHKDSQLKLDFINKWLTCFEIGDQLVVKPIIVEQNEMGVSYNIQENDTLFPIGDYGLGANVILLLLIRIVMAKENAILMLEEPESNLHPAFQSKLAELLADAHKCYKIRFVVETHSEYLIRKFQFLVASPDHDVKAEDISISYLYHPDKVPEGKKQVEKLIIEEDGGLDGEFGKGFFDEASNWKRELMRLKHAQKN